MCYYKPQKTVENMEKVVNSLIGRLNTEGTIIFCELDEMRRQKVPAHQLDYAKRRILEHILNNKSKENLVSYVEQYGAVDISLFISHNWYDGFKTLVDMELIYSANTMTDCHANKHFIEAIKASNPDFSWALLHKIQNLRDLLGVNINEIGSKNPDLRKSTIVLASKHQQPKLALEIAKKAHSRVYLTKPKGPLCKRLNDMITILEKA